MKEETLARILNEVCPACHKPITNKNAGGEYWQTYGGILCKQCQKEKTEYLNALYNNKTDNTKYMHSSIEGSLETRNSNPPEGQFIFVYYPPESPIPLEIKVDCDPRDPYSDRLTFKWGAKPYNKYDNKNNVSEQIWKYTGRFREKPRSLKNAATDISGMIPFTHKEIEEALMLIDAEIARVDLFKILDIEEEEISKEHLSETEKEEAMRLLASEELLKKILEVQAHKLVGEEESVLMTYLAVSTCKLPPQNRIGTQLTGDSSGGKTHVAKTVLELLPEEAVVDFTRMSSTALEHADSIDWNHKILFTAEAAGAEASIEVLKHYTDDSGSGSKLFTVEKDEGTNEYKSVLKESKGQPAFLTTTAKVINDYEFLNRLLTIPIDLSEKQTKRIIEFKGEKNTKPWKYTGDEKWKEVYRNAFRLLNEYPVVVPYAEALVKMVDTKKIKSRRDIDKVLWLIKASALVHQYQRATVKVKGKEYLIANFIDLVNAITIGKKGFERTFDNLHESTVQVMEYLKEHRSKLEVRDVPGVGVLGFTVQDLLQHTKSQGWTRNFLYSHLNPLCDVGFLNKRKKGKENYYWISDENSFKQNNPLSPKLLLKEGALFVQEYAKEAVVFVNGQEKSKLSFDIILDILKPSNILHPIQDKIVSLNDLTETVEDWIDFDANIEKQLKEYVIEPMEEEQPQFTPHQIMKNVRHSLRQLTKEYDNVTIDMLLNELKQEGIQKEQANQVINAMHKNGELFKPRAGLLSMTEDNPVLEEMSL